MHRNESRMCHWCFYWCFGNNPKYRRKCLLIRHLDNSFLLMPLGGLPLPEIIDNGLFEGERQRGGGVKEWEEKREGRLW